MSPNHKKKKDTRKWEDLTDAERRIKGEKRANRVHERVAKAYNTKGTLNRIPESMFDYVYKEGKGPVLSPKARKELRAQEAKMGITSKRKAAPLRNPLMEQPSKSTSQKMTATQRAIEAINKSSGQRKKKR